MIPIAQASHVDEFCFDIDRARMESRVFDSHFPHAAAGELRAVNLHRDREMLTERLTLLMNRRRENLFRSPLPPGEG